MDDRLNDLNEKPLVSVLMPTYNVAQYIECAVKSIIHQTYSNFELIIVDDCSSDGTYEILKQLAKEDQRVILAQNEKNSKICITLNKAWALSKGNFIIIVTDDVYRQIVDANKKNIDLRWRRPTLIKLSEFRDLLPGYIRIE